MNPDYFKLFAVTIVLLLISTSTHCQEGPGGTGNNSQSKYWYRLDNLSVNDGMTVSTINSSGSASRQARQFTSNQQPVYRSSVPFAINQNPVLSFDALDDGMQLQGGSDLSSGEHQDYHVSIVFRTGSDVSTRQCIYEQGGGSRGFNMYIFNGELYYGFWNFPNDGAGSPWGFEFIKTTIAPNSEYIGTISFDGNTSLTGTASGYLNGNNFATANNVGIFYNHGTGSFGRNIGNTVFETGSSNTSFPFNGEIAEFVQFDEAVNTTEFNLILNYLSSKFDIALTGTTDYHSKDTPGNGNFDYAVFGIGQENGSDLSDHGQGYGPVEIYNPSNLSDGEYLLVGDNNASGTTLSGTPAEVDHLMNKVWRVSESGDVGTVDIDINIGSSQLEGSLESDFYLLIDKIDTDFTNSTAIQATSVSNGIATFENVSLDDNDHFTFGAVINIYSGFIGPGGIGALSQYRFWFDANDLANTTTDGSTVQTWQNKGGNTLNAFQNSGSRRPTFNNNASSNMNNYPVLSFTTNDYLRINNNSDMNLGIHEEYSFYMVLRTSNDINTRQVLYEQGGQTNGLAIYIFNGDLYMSAHNLGSGNWGFQSIQTSISANQEYIIGYRMDGNSIQNGTLVGTLNGNDFGTINNIGRLVQHTGGIGIGAKYSSSRYETGGSNGTGQYFEGDIAEFIMFNEAISTSQHNIVTNYLSSKYDVNVSGIDLYNKDLTGENDYDHEVAGIGQIGQFDYHHKAKGEGMVMVSNPDDIDDGEYLLWGHDGNIICNSTNVPVGVTNRMTRLWKVNETGDVGNVNFDFILENINYGSIGNIVLLRDTDEDFSDAGIITQSGNDGDTVRFSNLNISDNEIFTIATINSFESTDITTTTWTGSNNTWNSASNWTNGVPNEKTKTVITNTGNIPNIDANYSIFSIELQPNSGISFLGNDSLYIKENFINNSELELNNGTIMMTDGCSVRNLTTSIDIDLNKLVTEADETNMLGIGKITINEHLRIIKGDFNTNNNLVIESNENGTGRILSIPSDATVSGDIEMRRYIDQGETQWRFFSSAITGIDLEQYDDDFLTSGIEG